MNKRTRIPILFLIFLVTPLSSAFNASSDIHSIGSYSMGSAENILEGVDLTGRDSLSYQQGVGRNATSTIYSLNLGGSKQVIGTPSEELTTPEEIATGGGTSEGGGFGCSLGYKPVNGTCVEISEEIPSQLFDITFTLEDYTIVNSNELEAVITFESFGTVPTLVDLTFIILDSSGNEVYREESDITVTTEEILRWKYENLDELSEGEYTAVLKTLYNVDVSDEFRQEFEIGRERRGITGRAIEFFEGGEVLYSILVFGIIILISFVVYFIRKYAMDIGKLEGETAFEQRWVR